MRLAGKIALITGGGSGLGKEIARYFAREGAVLALADINLEAAQSVANEVAELGAKAIAVKADVASSAEVCAMFDTVVRELGTIDILVNNAGIAGGQGSTIATTDEGWQRMLAVHLDGSFFCTREALKIMEAKGAGNIINMSSVAGTSGIANSPHYCAAKAGIIGLTKSVAREVAAKGIRVNAVAPTYIDTPLLRNVKDDPDRYQRLVAQIPMGRLGEASDVAGVVLFLASDDASLMTGQIVSPNGGHVI